MKVHQLGSGFIPYGLSISLAFIPSSQTTKKFCLLVTSDVWIAPAVKLRRSSGVFGLRIKDRWQTAIMGQNTRVTDNVFLSAHFNDLTYVSRLVRSNWISQSRDVLFNRFIIENPIPRYRKEVRHGAGLVDMPDFPTVPPFRTSQHRSTKVFPHVGVHVRANQDPLSLLLGVIAIANYCSRQPDGCLMEKSSSTVHSVDSGSGRFFFNLHVGAIKITINNGSDGSFAFVGSLKDMDLHPPAILLLNLKTEMNCRILPDGKGTFSPFALDPAATPRVEVLQSLRF